MNNVAIKKEDLHGLIDIMDNQDLDTLFKVLLKFVPESQALPDEVISIQIANKEFTKGEFVSMDDIDWD